MSLPEAQKLRRASYAWIVQDGFEISADSDDDEPLFLERVLLDRVTVWCHTRADSRWGHRSTYGPTLATLDAALEWARHRTDEIVIRMNDLDFAPDKSRHQLPRWERWPGATIAFDKLGPLRRWSVSWKLGLQSDDFQRAHDGFAERLSAHAQASEVNAGTKGDALLAQFVVSAPDKRTAHHLASHVGLAAATGVPAGLSDVLNGRLDVKVAAA